MASHLVVDVDNGVLVEKTPTTLSLSCAPSPMIKWPMKFFFGGGRGGVACGFLFIFQPVFPNFPCHLPITATTTTTTAVIATFSIPYNQTYIGLLRTTRTQFHRVSSISEQLIPQQIFILIPFLLPPTPTTIPTASIPAIPG